MEPEIGSEKKEDSFFLFTPLLGKSDNVTLFNIEILYMSFNWLVTFFLLHFAHSLGKVEQLLFELLWFFGFEIGNVIFELENINFELENLNFLLKINFWTRQFFFKLEN